MYKKSIGLRIVSFIIDVLMIYLLALIMYFIFGFGELLSNATGFQYNLNVFELTFASFIYFLLFALIAKGKTIGKLITRVEIKGNNFQEVPLNKIIFREVIKSLLIIINFISFIVLLVTKERKSIHDLIVDTIVVRKLNRNDYIYNTQQEPAKIEEPVSSDNDQKQQN